MNNFHSSRNFNLVSSFKGKTNKKIAEKDKEELVWVNYNEVESKLSYQNLKDFWNKVKEKVEKI